MMSEIEKLDLGTLLSSIKPSLVTPHLSDITALNTNEKKLRIVSRLIVKSMVESFNDSPAANIPRIILHDGKATEVRHFNVEPLITGVWPAMSLMLLQLSYGEQTTLIEALYPKTTQFTAKCFASAFTKDEGTAGSTTHLELKTDSNIEKKLDSANAGIAMILAMLGEQGIRTPHPDKVSAKAKDINDLVMEAAKSASFRRATKRAQDAMQSRDR